jgi:HlyD family secretion protein
MPRNTSRFGSLFGQLAPGACPPGRSGANVGLEQAGMKKKTLIWAAMVVAIAGGAFLLLGGRRRAEAKYRTAVVDKGNVTQTVAATGTLSAVTTVKVGSVVSGNVAALHADFNKQVKKGDLLAELDPIPFQEKVNQSKAALEKARVDERNSEISLRRQKALWTQQLAAQADLDQAQANFDSAVAAVNQAKANLSSSETDLRNSKIIAPIDGVVVDREYDVGQPVAASFQAPTIFTIAQDLTKMQVSADVSESDIGMCKVGQPVRFTVDAYPDQTFRGKIAQIRLNATVNQNVVTYPVIIEVKNEDLALRPSMTANVSIDVATVQDVLRVPNAALRFRPEESEKSAQKPMPQAVASQAPGGPATGGPAAGGPGGGQGRGRPGGPIADASRQFDRSASGGGPRKKAGQTVYTIPASLADSTDPKPIEIRTGITDGRFTQVASGELKPGDTVIVGLVTTKADATGRPPGMPGPGGPGGARRF